MAAALLSNEGILIVCLDPFGGHLHVQAGTQLRDRSHDRRTSRIGRQLVHEAAVDLDPVDREAVKITQRRVAGPEIVERDTHPQVADTRERAQRRLLIQYPKRATQRGMMQADRSHLPLKLNTAGVIPPIFASSLLLMPITVIGFSAGSGPEWLTNIAAYLGRGQPVYLLIYISMVVFFAFFYTAVVFNPTETADNLKRYGGFIPGIRPGKNTAEYLDWVLTRLTVTGASYLAAICLLPELLISRYSVPFYFGGTSLLIVVTVTMDTVSQVQSHLLAHQYEGLIRKSRLKGRR